MDNQPIRKKTKDEIHVHPHTKRFARYLGYTPNDLLFNRQGYLSPRQTQQLRNSLVVTLGKYLLFIIGLAIFIAYDMTTSKGGYTLSTLAGLAMGVIFIFMIGNIITHRQDIRNGRVEPLVGPAHRRRYQYRNRATRSKEYDHYVKIAGKEYEIDEELYKLCEQNFIYCAYISVSTHEIIAMEVVDESIHDMPEWMRESYEKTSIDDFKPAVNQKSPLALLRD